ncbi:MAG TPA: phosphatase PAP2 family protein [Gaiellaceae bacterium]
MDFRVFELLNGAMNGRDGLDDFVAGFASWSVPLFAAATLSLWFLDRPSGPVRWKLATACACTAAGLGLLVNQLIGRIWFRERPFASHPAHTVLLAQRSRDPSFPSDHASAAFAIAFVVLFFSLRAGAVFIAWAAAIGLSRILVGLHYPSDVLAGAGIGLACAVLVTTIGRDPVARVAVLAGRLTDPVVAAATRRFDRARRSLSRSRHAD